MNTPALRFIMVLYAILVTGIFLVMIGWRSTIDREKSNLLFREWDGEQFSPVDAVTTDSPSATFSFVYSWENPDVSDKQLLYVVHKAGGEKIIIGKSVRGIEAHWVITQLGDILVIKNLIDTHFDESFVIYPHINDENEMVISVLYATPDQDFFDKSHGGIPPERIMTSVKNISYDGIMTIYIGWDFLIHGVEGGSITTQIPLFYGTSTETETGNSRMGIAHCRGTLFLQ